MGTASSNGTAGRREKVSRSARSIVAARVEWTCPSGRSRESILTQVYESHMAPWKCTPSVASLYAPNVLCRSSMTSVIDLAGLGLKGIALAGPNRFLIDTFVLPISSGRLAFFVGLR